MLTAGMHGIDFDEVLEKIVSKDPRYTRDAYVFVREALDHTQRMIGKPQRADEQRHVTGQQLLHGIREFALSQYGPMAMTVLNEWGVRRCDDFGEIVFNMVDNSLLARTESDSRTDFSGGYTFEDAFQKPFIPAKKVAGLTAPKLQNS